MPSIPIVRPSETRLLYGRHNRGGRTYKKACRIMPFLAAAIASPALAGNGEVYVGAFGGMAWSERQEIRQSGMAHRRGVWRLDGYRDFDLRVAVEGRSEADMGQAFGVHLGYMFAPISFGLRPGVELEYAHYSTSDRVRLSNPNTERAVNIGAPGTAGLADPGAYVEEHYAAGQHRFSNRIRLNYDTLMVNGVLFFDTGSRLTPYVGAGAGVAFVSAGKGASYQTNPGGPIELTNDTAEPVNHFNSRDHDVTRAFAGQVKVGLRAKLAPHLAAFVEYRMLYVSSSTFAFGSTQYSGHPPTDEWNVRRGPANLHSGLFGVSWTF